MYSHPCSDEARLLNSERGDGEAVILKVCGPGVSNVNVRKILGDSCVSIYSCDQALEV